MRLKTYDLTHTQKRVLVVLLRRWSGTYDNLWISFSALAAIIHRPEKQVRDEVRKLRDKGWLEHLPMGSEEGIPCGSGYFLTKLARTTMTICPRIISGQQISRN